MLLARSEISPVSASHRVEVDADQAVAGQEREADAALLRWRRVAERLLVGDKAQPIVGRALLALAAILSSPAAVRVVGTSGFAPSRGSRSKRQTSHWGRLRRD